MTVHDSGRGSKRPAAAPSADGPEAVTQRVAGELKRARVDRGWSLARLAEVSEVSRSMISQIETSKTTPTIAVLWKLVTALDLPFSAMLGDEEPAPIVRLPKSDTVTLRTDDGRVTSRALFVRSRDRRVELYELTFEPRAEVRSPPHAPGTTENVVVCRGRLGIEVGDRHLDLRTGDAAEFRADLPHRYVNPTARPTVIHDVVVYP